MSGAEQMGGTYISMYKVLYICNIIHPIPRLSQNKENANREEQIGNSETYYYQIWAVTSATNALAEFTITFVSWD